MPHWLTRHVTLDGCAPINFERAEQLALVGYWFHVGLVHGFVTV